METSKENGIGRIMTERSNQKKRYSVEADHKKFERGQLAYAATLLAFPGDIVEDVAVDLNMIPREWDQFTFMGMLKRSYTDRLAIAGALLAAELDREILEREIGPRVNDIPSMFEIMRELLEETLVKMAPKGSFRVYILREEDNKVDGKIWYIDNTGVILQNPGDDEEFAGCIVMPETFDNLENKDMVIRDLQGTKIVLGEKIIRILPIK